MNKYRLQIFFVIFLYMNFNMANADEKLVFALLSQVCDQKGEKNQEMCQESVVLLNQFIDDFCQNTQIPMEMQLYTHVDDFVHLFKNGEIDGGYIKLGAYLKLQKESNQSVEIIGISTQSNGSHTYHSACITLQNKFIKWKNLKGKTIGLIQDSVSGNLLPKKILKEKGLYNPKHIVMFSDYYAAAKALESKKVDAVFGADMAFNGDAFGDSSKFKQQFILHPPLPMAFFVVNTDRVSRSTINLLKRVITTIEIPFNGQGINTFAGFKLFEKKEQKSIDKLIDLIE